jgi:deoxyxylulose-5-phosphate synthase
VLVALNQLPNVAARVKILAVPDRFIDHKTTREEQLAEVGLDAEGIEHSVRHALQPSLI